MISLDISITFFGTDGLKTVGSVVIVNFDTKLAAIETYLTQSIAPLQQTGCGVVRGKKIDDRT